MNVTAPYLLWIILMPLVGMAFILLGKEDERHPGRNSWAVAVLTVAAAFLLVVWTFMQIEPGYGRLQLAERYVWLETPHIEFVFAADSFSLLLLTGICLSVLIGLWGVKEKPSGQKPRMVFALLFLSTVSGFLVSADIFSFFIFFLVMLLPLFMLAGMSGDIKKQGSIFRFMLYNLFGAMLMFAAVVVLCSRQNGSILLNEIDDINLRGTGEVGVWLAVFVAFLSRIPVWPFHYWIAAVNSGVKNPLVFIIANIMPLTGIYGFIRFWPERMPDVVMYFMVVLEAVILISMVFIALIGKINKDIYYKIFSFISVYYIFYLLGLFLPTDELLLNLGSSLFACLLIFSVLAVLVSYLEEQQENENLPAEGMLCGMPRLSAILGFILLAGAGAPLTAMFINNFVILSALLANNLPTALTAMLALLLVILGLLQEFYRRRNGAAFAEEKFSGEKIRDIGRGDLIFFSGVVVLLLLSFFNPLWFLRG